MKQKISPTSNDFLTYLKSNATDGLINKTRLEMAEIRGCSLDNISRQCRILEQKGHIKREWPLGGPGRNPDGSRRLINIIVL